MNADAMNGAAMRGAAAKPTVSATQALSDGSARPRAAGALCFSARSSSGAYGRIETISTRSPSMKGELPMERQALAIKIEGFRLISEVLVTTTDVVQSDSPSHSVVNTDG